MVMRAWLPLSLSLDVVPELTCASLPRQLYRGGSSTRSVVFPEHSRNGSPHGTFTLPRSSTSKHSIGACHVPTSWPSKCSQRAAVRKAAYCSTGQAVQRRHLHTRRAVQFVLALCCKAVDMCRRRRVLQAGWMRRCRGGTSMRTTSRSAATPMASLGCLARWDTDMSGSAVCDCADLMPRLSARLCVCRCSCEIQCALLLLMCPSL